MLFTCAHVYTRTTHAHARALYLDTHAKPNAFLRTRTRVLQGIYIRGRTYAHAHAQISSNIYSIHYYDQQHGERTRNSFLHTTYATMISGSVHYVQMFSYTSGVFHEKSKNDIGSSRCGLHVIHSFPASSHFLYICDFHYFAFTYVKMIRCI